MKKTLLLITILLGYFNMWAQDPPIMVDCEESPVNTIICYGFLETVTYTFESSDGSNLNLIVNSGYITTFGGDFVVTDSDGTVLYSDTGNGGDLTGVSVQSIGDQITVTYTSSYYPCNTSGFTEIDVSVSCASCINPVVSTEVVSNCDNNNEGFFAEINITDLGSSESLIINDNQGSASQSVDSPDTFTFGPYPNDTMVDITVANENDENCFVTQSVIQEFCPPINNDCEDATQVTVNDSIECIESSPGTLAGATPSGFSDSCVEETTNDIWFKFTATAEDLSISFLGISQYSSIYHAVYEGDDCNDLSLLYCADNFQESASLAEDLTIGNTYYIRVFSTNQNLTTSFDLCITTPEPRININTNNYTVEELVTDVLFNNPCTQISNITYSTGTNYEDVNGIGYFNYNNSNFPIESGIILSSGNVANASGPESDIQAGGSYAWPGDEDLDNALDSGGESYNASIIEFDFIPFINDISFDFLFASDEYAVLPCGTTFTDGFVFLLSDEDGNTENLAVVPETTIPISSNTIFDEQYSPGCESQNEEYFGTYYGINGVNPFDSPINFKGNTVVMTAEANVIPGQQYHIKLVVADKGDTGHNSAVFIAAGSFDLGAIDLGDDITTNSGNASCNGETVILDTGVDNPEDATIEWYQEGELIAGENDPTLEVTEEGNYTVAVVYIGACGLTDSINVEFFDNPEVNLGDDLTLCEGNSLNIDATPTNVTDLDNIIYSWTLDGTQIDGETNSTLEVNQAGTYTVEVSANGCLITDEVVVDLIDYEVNLPQTPICISIGDPNSFELSSEITGISSSELPNVNYEWSFEGTVITDETNPSLIITEEGLYTVTTSYMNCNRTATFEAIFGHSPIISLGEDQIVCPNSTVTLDATPTNNSEFDSLTYKWFQDGTELTGETTATYNATAPGTYTVEVIGTMLDANGNSFSCDTGNDSITINNNNTFTVSLGSDQDLCNESSYTIESVVTGEDASNASYVWEDSNGVISGETSSSLVVTEDGDYMVTVEIDGCTAMASVNVVLNESPSLSSLEEEIVTCSLSDAILDATPSNFTVAETTYSWTYEGSSIAETGAIVNASDYGYGSYEVTAYADSPDCSTTISIDVIERDDIGVSLSSDQSSAMDLQYCSDLSDEVPSYELVLTAELSNVEASEVDFVWYENGNVLSGETGSSYTVVYDAEGDYNDTYEVEIVLGGCSAFGAIDTDVSITPYENGCVITEGLSPNSSPGQNDCMDLSFLDDRTGIRSLKVYNRHGRLVYDQSNYVNSFCGQDQDGEDLQTGTYYYVLEFSSEDPVFGNVKKGWVYINREVN
ncbi:choice-of-anchor L domain-containing protein [Mesonia aquimarina]|uniref:choice-of-anchor L domain-containing protein n=1 Tax=Mesonia aquimarina TaxID=1504967 RepID=UPI000EF5DDA2|nr:choice-of-anchor L domain-containing protein [Mesonia aquimarina]